MKKLAAMLCLSAVATGAFAQGIINFGNSATTLISQNVGGNISTISGAAGSFYFGLLVAAPGTTVPTAFTFTGNYSTNSGVAAGRFVLNAAQVPAASWGPGVSKAYEIAGWSSSLGATFQPAWLTQWAAKTGPAGLFGVSAIGTGAAGGTDATGNSIPPYSLFGGTGLTQGFTLTNVPEPSSLALAGLGAAALLIFRRRK
jgi:hypothetical protein